MKKKKIKIFITNSLGELDVIIPICMELKKKNNLDIEIIFTVKKIFDCFISNKFYLFTLQYHQIKFSKLFLVNKFDININQIKFFKNIDKVFYLFITILKLPLLYFKMKEAKYIFYEFAEQSQVKFIYFLNFILNKKIYTYCHGVALHPGTSSTKKRYAHKSKYLLFHEMNKSLSDSMGYNNYVKIGIPKFFKSWLSFINDISTQFQKKERYVVIYSRAINDYYMPKEIYKKLILESYEAINSVLGNILIIFKPHPREDLNQLRETLNEYNMTNTEISDLHSTVLAKHALFGLSLWTSCVIDCLSVNTPVIEYFKEGKKFREVEPKGSTYKNIGFKSCNNINELKKIISEIDNGLYNYPKNIHEIFKFSNTNFLD